MPKLSRHAGCTYSARVPSVTNTIDARQPRTRSGLYDVQLRWTHMHAAARRKLGRKMAANWCVTGMLTSLEKRMVGLYAVKVVGRLPNADE